MEQESRAEKMEKLRARKALLDKQRQRAHRVVESPNKQRPVIAAAAAAATTATAAAAAAPAPAPAPALAQEPAAPPVAMAAAAPAAAVTAPVSLRAAPVSHPEVYRGSDTGIAPKSAPSPSTKQPYRRSASSGGLGPLHGPGMPAMMPGMLLPTSSTGALAGTSSVGSTHGEEGDWAARLDQPYGAGSVSPRQSGKHRSLSLAGTHFQLPCAFLCFWGLCL